VNLLRFDIGYKSDIPRIDGSRAARRGVAQPCCRLTQVGMVIGLPARSGQWEYPQICTRVANRHSVQYQAAILPGSSPRRRHYCLGCLYLPHLEKIISCDQRRTGVTSTLTTRMDCEARYAHFTEGFHESIREEDVCSLGTGVGPPGAIGFAVLQSISIEGRHYGISILHRS